MVTGPPGRPATARGPRETTAPGTRCPTRRCPCPLASGTGTGGVALSGFFTPRIHQRGENLPFIAVAVALAVMVVVTAWALAVVAVFAIVVAFDPPLFWIGTIAFLAMAAGLGTASGAIFLSRVTPQAQVGSVTGIVGAMGGLGGFLPPLIMGAVYSTKGSYAIGLMLLSDLALAGCVYAYLRMRTAGRSPV